MNSAKNKVDRLYVFLFWFSGIILCSFWYALDYRQLSGVQLTMQNIMVGRDFFNLWSGGSLAISGNEEIIYDHVKYREWQNSIFSPVLSYNYSYPPHSLLLAIPFSLLDYQYSLFAWTAFGIISFLLAARYYMPQEMPKYLAVLTPAALINIWAGHYGFIIGALWLLFFAALDHKPIRSGIFAGLLTLKPHLGLLIAFTLLLKHAWRSVFAAICTTIILFIASGLAFGFDLWRQWIVDTSALQAEIMSVDFEPFYYRMMTSTYISLRGLDEWAAISGQVVTGAIALYLFWIARKAHYTDLAFIAATATMLIVPYAFNYDLTVVSLGFGVLLFKRWSYLSMVERVCIWLAFMAPVLVMTQLISAPLLLLFGLFVQVRQTVPGWRYSAVQV